MFQLPLVAQHDMLNFMTKYDGLAIFFKTIITTMFLSSVQTLT